MACLFDTFRDNATIGVEQNKPIFTPGVANLEECEAIAKSQLATIWHPAAVAVPSTSAITGLGLVTIAFITSLHLSNKFLK